MMYRLGYDRTVTFCTLLDLPDLPHDADLSRLEWRPTEMQLDEERLRLALRDARATPEGIVFSQFNWSARQKLDEQQTVRRETIGSRAPLLVEAEQMDRTGFSAGMADSWRQEWTSMDEMHAQLVAKLRREVDEVLAQPIPDDVRAACQAHGLPVS